MASNDPCPIPDRLQSKINSQAGETPSPEELSEKSSDRCVLVCQHRTCLNNNSAKVLAAFEAAKVPGFKVEATGCQGQCSSGPTVRILPEETWYWRVTVDDVPIIVEEHLKGGKPVDAKLNRRVHLSWEMYSP
jgi:(2Fe-2S) ferredoxin